MRSHRFAYMTVPARADDFRPHELRDGDAYATMLPALMKLKYEAGATFINHPVCNDAPDMSLADMSSLSEEDLLVITSRPPMNEKDSDDGPRQMKLSHPSGNQFEQTVLFPMLRRYLSYCSRDQIVLHPDQAQRLDPRYRNRGDLDFYLKPNQNKSRYEAAYRMTAGGRKYERFAEDRTTAAYLIHTPPLEMPGGKNGARVLAAFGVSGTIGFVFAHHLRHQKLPAFAGLFEDALKKPGFAMMEITVTKDVPPFYTTLDFTDEWDYKLITRWNGASEGVA